MQFPLEPEKAFELFAKLQLLSDGLEGFASDKPITLLAGWVKALILGPSLQELRKGGSVRDRSGVSAGALLWAAYLYEQTGKRVTLNSAIELVTRQVENKQLGALGVKPFPNKGELHTAWKAMRHVAHLWAGFCVVDIAVKNGVLEASSETMHSVLRIAKAFGAWGTKRMVPSPGGVMVPMLDPSAIWHLPKFVPCVDLGPLPMAELPQFVTDPIGKR